MAITSITRDWGFNPAIVRITSTDSYGTISAAGYLTRQAVNIAADNTGAFEWAPSDAVLVYYAGGWAFFTISPDQTSLIPLTTSNIQRFDITAGFAALAAGGAVNLLVSSGAHQYKIVSLWTNLGGTNFSGGGGNRLGQITDGTTVYSVIPAASLQTIANAGWGMSAALPFPATAAIDTSTAAGASLQFKYSGGTTDYTAGSIVISGLVQQVA